MIFLRKPSVDRRAALRAVRRHGPPTFHAVGVTLTEQVPPGFHLDRYQVVLGRGAVVFERAREALRAWKMFPAPWTEIFPAVEPARDLVVSVAVKFGLWFLFTARVVYLIQEEAGHTARFGFAYATQPGHPEIGEERFLVEWNRDTDEVTYQIYAVSRPGAWFTWLGYPLTRMLQKRFGRDSCRAMGRLVGEG